MTLDDIETQWSKRLQADVQIVNHPSGVAILLDGHWHDSAVDLAHAEQLLATIERMDKDD